MIYSLLKKKIEDKSAKVSIIGLGYAGLPLAVEFAKGGFRVMGIDIDDARVNSINQGNSYITDLKSEDLIPLVEKELIRASKDFELLKEADSISICVPTPLRKTKDPDISYIVAVTKEIKKFLRPGQLIVLESTTYPGTTEEIILPEFEELGLEVGQDFFLAFSPERVDPGNPKYNTRNTPKVIGGITQRCTEIAKFLYEQIILQVVPLNSAKEAEMVKLVENTFRSVNIALANELALLSDKMGIDIWNVIDAAASKPFGYIPFYPGPGLGGHCIPVDPFYLSWKAKSFDFYMKFIELAAEANGKMPYYVMEKITKTLNEKEKSVKASKIFVLGVTYKKDVNDVRESPALDIIRLLIEKGAKIFYNDPFIPTLREENLYMDSAPLELMKEVDLVVIVTDHSQYDYPWIVKNAPLIVDTRNATKGVKGSEGKVIKI